MHSWAIPAAIGFGAGAVSAAAGAVVCFKYRHPAKPAVDEPSDEELEYLPPGRPSELALSVYASVVARRIQWDVLLWQVPALALTGVTIAWTIALSGSSSELARILASVLGLVIPLLAMHLMARNRQAEIMDAHWLERFEKAYTQSYVEGSGLGLVVHGLTFQMRRKRERAGGPLSKLHAFPIWMLVFGLLSLTSIAILVVAVASPSSL